jgi:hypothetical protein
LRRFDADSGALIDVKEITMPETPIFDLQSIAAAGGELAMAGKGLVYTLDPETAEVLLTRPLSDRVRSAVGLAYDDERQLLWITNWDIHPNTWDLNTLLAVDARDHSLREGKANEAPSFRSPVGALTDHRLEPADLELRFGWTSARIGTETFPVSIDMATVAHDDGLPLGSRLRYRWRLSAVHDGGDAEAVSIVGADDPTARMTFTDYGTYHFIVTIDDGAAISADHVEVFIRRPVDERPEISIASITPALGERVIPGEPLDIAVVFGGAEEDLQRIEKVWIFDAFTENGQWQCTIPASTTEAWLPGSVVELKVYAVIGDHRVESRRYLQIGDAEEVPHVDLGATRLGYRFESNYVAESGTYGPIPLANPDLDLSPEYAGVTLRPTGDMDVELAVNIAFDGEGELGVDYFLADADGVAIDSPVIIPVGINTVDLQVRPIDNTTYEFRRDFTMRILPADDGSYQTAWYRNYARDLNDSYDLRLEDDDLYHARNYMRLQVMQGVGTEGDGDLVFRFYRTGPEAVPSTVAAHDLLLEFWGDAERGVDYLTLDADGNDLPEDRLHLPAGVNYADLIVRPLSDGLREGIESVGVGLVWGGSSSYYRHPSDGSRGMGQIIDDSGPIVTMHEQVPDAVENGGVARIELRRSDAVGNLTVAYLVRNSSSATNGIDVELLPGFILMPDGVGSVELSIAARADEISVGTEELTLQPFPAIIKSARTIIRRSELWKEAVFPAG